MKRLISGAERLGLHLSPRQIEQFEVYYRELVDWNRQLNLTAITSYEAVQANHFLDTLTVALVWRPPDDGHHQPRLLDVGTGGGMPGLPLKVTFPAIHLTLLDATAKKAAFLHHLVDTLAMQDTEIVVGRAEEVGHDPRHRGAFDLVLSRAVAALPGLVELTLPFCTVGGLTVLHKRGDIAEELDRAGVAIDTLGGRLREVRPVDLPEFPDRRSLVVIDKVSPTPEKYPRRPGIPTRRPLG